MTNPVHVKFFAIFREYVGLKEDWREIEPGTTVQELWNHYTANAKNPRVANIRAAFSVNQRLAKGDTVLNGGEEVGFLPPVSGGAGKPARPKIGGRKTTARLVARKTTSRAGGKSPSSGSRPTRAATRNLSPSPGASLDRDFLVTPDALDLSALVTRVTHPGAGAITTFIGIVRDNAHDRAVRFLEYEAYPELAEQVLAQIGDEVAARWPDVRLAIAHRTGRLDIGVASVFIAASAPHRAEAFGACRYAIERLKVILPVWKKEFASDSDYWVEGPTPGEVPAADAEQTLADAEHELAESLSDRQTTER